MKKLALVYPWDSPFIFSAGVERFLNMEIPKGYEARWFRGKGWCQARMHTHCCEQALEWGADLICFLGSDQIHPEDMLPRLANHMEEGAGAVSALIPFRGYLGSQEMVPFGKLAWRKVDDGKKIPPVAIDPKAGDLQKIDFIGSGVILFRAEYLRRLKKPWFWDRIEDSDRQIRKSNFDVEFVWALQNELGVQMYVDTTIDVRHLHVFEIDETFQDRFADWAEPDSGDPSICKASSAA